MESETLAPTDHAATSRAFQSQEERRDVSPQSPIWEDSKGSKKKNLWVQRHVFRVAVHIDSLECPFCLVLGAPLMRGGPWKRSWGWFCQPCAWGTISFIPAARSSVLIHFQGALLLLHVSCYYMQKILPAGVKYFLSLPKCFGCLQFSCFKELKSPSLYWLCNHTPQVTHPVHLSLVDRCDHGCVW